MTNTLNAFAAAAIANVSSDNSQDVNKSFKDLAHFLQFPAVEAFLTESNVSTDWAIDTHSVKHFDRVIGFAMSLPAQSLAETMFYGLKTILLHGNADQMITSSDVKLSQEVNKCPKGKDAKLFALRAKPSANSGNWHNRVLSLARELGIVTEQFRGTFSVNMESAISKGLCNRFGIKPAEVAPTE